MKVFELFLKSTVIGLLSIALISCGGGGSSNSGASTSTGISGTAAVGAPILGAAVTVYDSTGAIVGTTTTSTTDGSYSISSIGGTAPYTVQVSGPVGDAVGIYYAVVGSTGTANVNQISNGIAASLSSTGNPADLVKSNASSASSITNTENAFLASLTNVLKALGFSGSPVTAGFSGALDGALDQIDIVLLPDGSYEMATSEGQAMPDLMDDFANGSSSPSVSSHKVVSYAKTAVPSASDANNLPAPSQSIVLTAALLEPLRQQLQTCFSATGSARASNSAAATASPAWTISDACKNLAFDDGSGHAFKHDSYYWIDNLSSNSTTNKSGCSSAGSGWCLGLFGTMLLDSKYDKATFLKPYSIRSVGTNLWHVKFPIVLNDGVTRVQFGDSVGTEYTVVKYDPATNKYYFWGNQRDVQIKVEPAVTMAQYGSSNNYRVETGMNIYVNPYNSRTLAVNGHNPVYPVKAIVQPDNINTGMLPAGGVSLANKISATSTGSYTLANSGVSSNKSKIFNVCTFMNYEDPTLISASYTAGTTGASSCSGVIRMDYAEFVKSASGALTKTTGAYRPISTAIPTWISAWNQDKSLTTPTLGTSSLVSSTTAKRGESYLFTITMSDGSVKKYHNRLPHDVLSTTAAASLNYPSFASGVASSFAAFTPTGANTAFSPTWNALQSSYIFATAIFWDRGEIDNTVGVAYGATGTQSGIACNSNSTVIAGQNYAGNAVTNILACSDPLMWKSNGASAPDQGVLQLKSRTYDGLFIQSQIRQY